MFERTKKLCEDFLQMGVPGLDLIAYQKGKCVFRHSAGFSDREKGIFVSGKERYFIYSCSKPITVTAAMQLWEEGKFSLEDPLSRYLPEFAQMKVQGEDGVLRDAENPILIEHLFQMAAGFSYNVRSPRLMALREDTDGRCPTLLSMKYLAEEPLGFEPGTRYRYSLCHDVLAALVEKISETEFSQRVKQKIFDPLGMEHSDFLLPPEQWDDVAALYRRNLETNEIVRIPNVVSYRLGPEYASGGAGCVSTVEDYILFGEALLRGEKLLKRDTVRLMTTDRLTPARRATFTLEQYGYGLGMRCPKEGGSRTDFGWGGAAGAYFAVSPAHDVSFFYAQHVLSSPNQSQRGKLFLTFLEELTGESLLEGKSAQTANHLTY